MFRSTPPIVKNLLIINALILLASIVMANMGFDLAVPLGLHHWTSEYFNPIQLVSYMFMHGGFTHLLFNMFALWMFGRLLEQVWGGKRFLIYYIVTGIGAGLIQLTVMTISLNSLENEVMVFQNEPTREAFDNIMGDNIKYMSREEMPFINEVIHFMKTGWVGPENNPAAVGKAIEFTDYLLNFFRNIPTVGASGSVFGILLAFGMMFPNMELMLLFPPIPIKAKYFVIGYGVLELYSGISNNPGDNTAHFAHLGGMLFGFILIKYWKKKSNNYF